MSYRLVDHLAKPLNQQRKYAWFAHSTISLNCNLKHQYLNSRPLFTPCKCSGSIAFTHHDCLVEWLNFTAKQKKCELCGHRWPGQADAFGIELPITNTQQAAQEPQVAGALERKNSLVEQGAATSGEDRAKLAFTVECA